MVRPYEMVPMLRHTFFWKGVPANYVFTVKRLRLPAKYSRSSRKACHTAPVGRDAPAFFVISTAATASGVPETRMVPMGDRR